MTAVATDITHYVTHYPVLSAVRTLCAGNTGRKFVARFSVFSEAVGWEGSTGPNTVLWCEYLTPWVLRKEVHTILKVSAIPCTVLLYCYTTPVQQCTCTSALA
jgi:hypothetical protein